MQAQYFARSSVRLPLINLTHSYKHVSLAKGSLIVKSKTHEVNNIAKALVH